MPKRARSATIAVAAVLLAGLALLLFGDEGATPTTTVLTAPERGISAALQTLGELNAEIAQLIEWEQTVADMNSIVRMAR